MSIHENSLKNLNRKGRPKGSKNASTKLFREFWSNPEHFNAITSLLHSVIIDTAEKTADRIRAAEIALKYTVSPQSDDDLNEAIKLNDKGQALEAYALLKGRILRDIDNE